MTDVDVEQSHDAFTTFVTPHVPAMRRVIAARAPGADTEDLLQDALTRAWLKRHTFDESRGTAQHWLLAIAFDRARRASTRHVPSYELTTDEQVAHGKDVDADLDLRRAVVRLSGRQREAVVLHYYADLPVDAVAAVMGCAAGTVKSTLSDARRRLAELLGELP